MIDRTDVERLLALQTRAYELLMWLGAQAAREPSWLAPEVVTQLQKPMTAAQWLERHRHEFPTKLVPSGPFEEGFAALFSSFFDTSFRVNHLASGEILLDSALKLGALEERSPAGRGMDHSQALALKHLASFEKMFLEQGDARRLAKKAHLREASLIWTYVWELDRRAQGKGKGPVARKIWRGIPIQVRKELSVELVWKARQQLVDAARAFVTARDGGTGESA
jgi:hypothetical protein